MKVGLSGRGIITLGTKGRGRPWGVALGFDFAAEHEGGIARLREKFGINASLVGVGARTITRLPAKFGYHEATAVSLIGIDNNWEDYANDSCYTQFMRQRCTEGESLACIPVCGTWSDSGFLAAILRNKTNFPQELYQAFLRHDIVIWQVGRRGPFDGSGLCIGIRSLIPEYVAHLWWTADVNRIRLQAAADQTGIAQRLQTAGRKWFALSPKWSQELVSIYRGQVKTQHPVVFYLNPQGQDRYNSGWFTVEELDQWADGTGPVVKAEPELQAA